MICMKFINYIKRHWIEVVFLLLLLAFLYMYFVTYLTPSRLAWYDVMEVEIKKFLYWLVSKGR